MIRFPRLGCRVVAEDVAGDDWLAEMNRIDKSIIVFSELDRGESCGVLKAIDCNEHALPGGDGEWELDGFVGWLCSPAGDCAEGFQRVPEVDTEAMTEGGSDGADLDLIGDRRGPLPPNGVCGGSAGVGWFVGLAGCVLVRAGS